MQIFKKPVDGNNMKELVGLSPEELKQEMEESDILRGNFPPLRTATSRIIAYLEVM